MKSRKPIVIVKRLLTSVLTLFLLLTFVFFLVRLAPGDPSQKYLSSGLDPVLMETVKESFQLNSPVHVQYMSFITNIFKGDLGVSYDYRMPVISVIGEHLPFTLIFSSVSFVLQIFLSFYFAIKAAKNLNGKFDKVFSQMMMISYSTPTFVLGVILVYIFSVKLDMLPSSGIQSVDSEKMNSVSAIFDVLKHMILPFITLSLVEVSIFYKYLRDNLAEVFNKTYILNLRAGGMNEKKILLKHVIPNAINPLLSIAGIELGILLGGTLIIEVIFGLPGMGRLTVNAILSRDYPLVIGCTLVSGFLMIAANLLADLIRVNLDKRFSSGALN